MNDSGYVPVAIPAGWRIIHLQSVDSTNDYAWRLAENGAPHGQVVVADRQTGGRGRRGRIWRSPPGANLTFSLVLRPAIPPAAAVPLSLVAAVALFSCLETEISCLTIKWPNDLYCGDRKLAGILSELKLRDRKTDFVVVGIGLNVNTLLADWPPELRETAISMRQAAGKQFQLPEVLQQFLTFFHCCYEQYCVGGLQDSVLEILRKYSYLSGRQVVVEVNGRMIQGQAGEIDEHGRLLVYDESGSCRPIAAGEATIVSMNAADKKGDDHDFGG